MKNSYCTGENGRIANDEANEMSYGTGVSGSAALAQAPEFLKAIPTGERKAGVALPAMSKLYGEADQNAKFDKDKLDRALKNVDQSCEEATEDQKRKYNSLKAEVDVTEEEMEAYRLRKDRGADRMAKLASSDEVLDYK
jgi:pre-mRNA-processing factor SLU7